MAGDRLTTLPAGAEYHPAPGHMGTRDWFDEYRAAVSEERERHVGRIRELEKENRTLWLALGQTRAAYSLLDGMCDAAMEEGDSPNLDVSENAWGHIEAGEKLLGGLVPLTPAK